MIQTKLALAPKQGWQWDLSYDSITSDVALRQWFKKSAEFPAEIEGSGPLITPAGIHDEEAVDGEDDEDIPMELSMLVVIGVDNGWFTYSLQVCRRLNSI